MNRLALMLAAGLAHWCVAPGARAQEAVADPVVEQVRAAWQERQRGYDSFIVEWEETGQSSRMIRDQGRQEVTETLTHRLTGDGGKLHYSRSGMQWDMSQLDVIEQEFVRVFDGDERRELWRRGRGEEHPAGFVNNSGLVFDELSFHVEPVLITFSPLNKRMTGIDFTDWRSADRRGSVADVPCLVLERGRGKDVTEVIWVADEAGFRPVRHELIIRGNPAIQLTIVYKSGGEEGHLPESWTISNRDPDSGTVKETWVARVSNIQLNPQVPRGLFDWKFPAGAVVFDEVKAQDSVVRADGTLRLITPGEAAAGIPFRELMSTAPPPEAMGDGFVGRNRYLFVLSLLAAALIGWRAWLRMRAAAGS